MFRIDTAIVNLTIYYTISNKVTFFPNIFVLWLIESMDAESVGMEVQLYIRGTLVSLCGKFSFLIRRKIKSRSVSL